MIQKSNTSTLIIGFLICLWLFYITMFTVSEDLFCAVCTPLVLFFTFFSMLFLRRKTPKITVTKDEWPDEQTVLIIVLIFIIWLVFGMLANSIINGSFDSPTYNQEELAERMSTVCLPICLLATIILIALEISHAKKARKHGATRVIKFDNNMSRAERVYLIERGLKKAGISEIVLDELDVLEVLPFCPDCGEKLTIDAESEEPWCGTCKKYV